MRGLVVACVALLAHAESSALAAPISDPAADERAAATMREVERLSKEGPFTADTARRLLRIAGDDKMPQGARNQALIAYGKVAAKAGMASEAAREVMELRKAAGLFAYEALIEVGPPALPQLMWVLSSCSDKQGQTGSLMDPKATIEMDEGTMAAAGVALIVEKHPAAPESKEAAPGLVRALGCGDSRVRMGAARALAMQERLEKPELVALRRLLRSDKRPHTRGLVAGVLGSVAPRDAESLGALDSALGDRAELVPLAAATALVRLGRDGRARATLEKLGKSKDPEISKLADNVSKEAAASPSAARDPGKPR